MWVPNLHPLAFITRSSEVICSVLLLFITFDCVFYTKIQQAGKAPARAVMRGGAAPIFQAKLIYDFGILLNAYYIHSILLSLASIFPISL